jgi:hypothetical protein
MYNEITTLAIQLILDPSTVNQLVRLDEGYFIFHTLRNSPVYLEKRKKYVFAMTTLGLHTWFGSFSSADTKWKDLLKVLDNLFVEIQPYKCSR